MKTQRNFGLKQLLLVFALVGFALPSRAHVIFEEIHYKHPHQYVYYPKQNFYYDPMFGQYLIVENGVWVRQPYPPRLLRKININILPHTDIYLTTMYPYHYNAEHRRQFRLMAALTPSTAFYAFKMPNRYDFSIGAEVYYCSPSVNVVFVDYNPNYYCHPFVGRPFKHHGPDHYGYLTIYARNDYYYYHRTPQPFGPYGHHDNGYHNGYRNRYGHPGPQKYAFGPQKQNNNRPYKGYPTKGHPNNNRGFERQAPMPNPGNGNGNGHGNHHGGGFGMPNQGQFPQQQNRPQQGPKPGGGNGHGNHGGGGFGVPNQGQFPQQQNRPQQGPRPGGGNGHGNQGGGKRAEVQQNPDIRQGNPKQPNDFQRMVSSANTVAVKALDKPNQNQDRNKEMHQKEVVLKHQFDYVNRENNNSFRQR